MTEAWVAPVAIAIGVVALLVAIAGIQRAVGTSRRVDRLTGAGPGTIEDSLVAAHDTLADLTRRASALESGVAHLDGALPGCLQRTSIVRYDAFENVGGNMSFSAAMLDTSRSGLIITCVHSRMDTRIYLKRVDHGAPDQPLTDEERRALEEAAG